MLLSQLLSLERGGGICVIPGWLLVARPSSAAQHLPGEAKTPLGSCGEVTQTW